MHLQGESLACRSSYCTRRLTDPRQTLRPALAYCCRRRINVNSWDYLEGLNSILSPLLLSRDNYQLLAESVQPVIIAVTSMES